MAIVKAYESEKFFCDKIDFKNFSEVIGNLNIEKFITDYSLILGENKIDFVDDNNPISFSNGFFSPKTLIIEKKFLHENKKEILEKLSEYLRNYNGEYVYLGTNEFISDEVINAILDNNNIKKIKLGCADEPFVLTKELFEKFKKANKEKIITVGISEELEDNFDSMIDFNQKKYLIDGYVYDSLTTVDTLFINSDVKPENFKYFSLMKKNIEINIRYDKCKNFLEILEYLRQNGFNNKISININDKNEFNAFLFKNINLISTESFENTYVNFVGSEHSLKDYCINEKKLIELVKPVLDLSPFEKYLFIYDIVNKFKEYKENEEDRRSARDLYQILNNDYIVCVGYSYLLQDLLSKVGIYSETYGVSVDTGLDNVPLNAAMLLDFIVSENKIQEVLTRREGHSRLFVNLVDEKYGINGYYIADPTWDNVMDKHAFNYSLMTHDEYDTMDRYNYMNLYGNDELFFIHSLNEFYYKLNVLLDKNKKRKVLDYVIMFFDYFKEIDLEFYSELINKYPNYRRIDSKKDKAIIQDILLDIGEHILSKTNNIVDGKKYRDGIRILFEKGIIKLDEKENIDSKVDEVMEYNRERNKGCFPIRYIIDKEGIELRVINGINKFDENLNLEHKK